MNISNKEKKLNRRGSLLNDIHRDTFGCFPNPTLFPLLHLFSQHVGSSLLLECFLHAKQTDLTYMHRPIYQYKENRINYNIHSVSSSY